ncbi:MAG: elongation factor P [Chitinivibrionia bacterium]|jgi:elongation factor P|nr:elongation factor P [Chitinivibrionia bacterium]
MATIKAGDISRGMVLLYEGQPCRVIDFSHTKTGRGSNNISAMLKNIINGRKVEHRFRTDEKVDTAFVETKQFEYLYEDGDGYVFMDSENFEQITLKEDEAGDAMGYLLPNNTCQIMLYDNKPIGVQPPTTVQLKITETEPGIKGATISGSVTKPATLETGLVIQVPMFIEADETVIVNTTNGEYSGRIEK